MKKNFDFSKLIYLLILIPFFKTDYITRFDIFNNIFSIWRIASIVLIILLLIKKGKISKSYLVMVMFCIFPIVLTILNSGNITLAINLFGSVLALSYLFEFEGNKIKFLEALLLCFKIVIYINFITMILFPKGLYSTGNAMIGTATSNWFLGFKNTMVVYFLPAYVLSYIHKNLTNKKLSYIIMSCVIIISILLSGSTTTLIGGIIMFVFTIFDKLRNKHKIFNLKNYSIASFAIFLSIVVLKIQNLFSFLIVNILKKDLSFTNRTFLWNTTLKYIFEKPIWGYGISNEIVRNRMYNSSTIITAHNQILEYMYIGGIIELLLFVILIILVVKNCKKLYNDKNVQIISLGFFVYQILNLTEVYLNPIMYIMLILAFYASKYVKKNDINDIRTE